MNPCSLSKANADEASNDWLCLGCNRPKPLTTSINVTLENPGPENGPLNFVYGFGIPLAKSSFLALFDNHIVKRDLFLGEVRVEGRGGIHEWVTVRGKESLIIRGGKNVACRSCSVCGRSVYFAMGSSYLFPEPNKRRDIFESDLFGLVISRSLFERTDFGKWRGLAVDKLSVLQQPRDGMGILS